MKTSYDAYASSWTQKIRSGKNVAHSFLEKPAMYAKIPDLHGKKVLCIGCGSGEECEYLQQLGAELVVGIDNSSELITLAEQAFPHINFKVMDMGKLDFTPNSFDFVYSSLTLHYSDRWFDILQQISRILTPSGLFLFSTHHPVRWGSQTIRRKTENVFKLGYTKNKQNNEFEIYGDYNTSRWVDDILFGQLPIRYFHQSISTIQKIIRESNFELLDFLEPLPTQEAKTKKPGFYEVHSKIPLFMIFELVNKKVE